MELYLPRCILILLIYTLFRHEAAIVQKHIKAQKHKRTKNRDMEIKENNRTIKTGQKKK